MQRPAHPPTAALRIQPIGNRQRVWIHLEHAVKRGAGPIHRLDPREVFLRDRSRGIEPRLHPLLEIGDRELFQIEARRRRRLGQCRAGRHRGDRRGHPPRARPAIRRVDEVVCGLSLRVRARHRVDASAVIIARHAGCSLSGPTVEERHAS